MRFKFFQVVYDYAVKKQVAVGEGGLVDDHGDALGLNALHHALDGARPEVVAVALHGQAVHANGVRSPGDDRVCDKVFPGAVGVYDGLDHILRDLSVIRKQLLRIFRQTIAAVAEGRVVVVVANSRIQTHAFDNGPGIQALGLRVRVKLVKVGHPDRQKCIGEEFDGFGLRGVGD